MAKLIVRSYVSIEIEIDTENPIDLSEDPRGFAVNEAGNQISALLKGYEFDFFEEAIVYDEDGEEIEDSA